MCSPTFFGLLMLFVYSNAQRLPFEAIVSFGDSTTDTGKVYNLTSRRWPIVPPYFQGRFSNGPVWIEKLGVSKLNNYAFGGATTDDNLTQGYTASDTIRVPGVRQQIKMYLKETDRTSMDFPRTLYVIRAGGNDYYFNQTITPSSVATSILNAVKDLIHIGVKHILVVNQAPVHTMPFIESPAQAKYFEQRTIHHNGNLSTGIVKLEYDRARTSVYLFDVYSLVLNITMNNSSGLSNTNSSCWYVANGNVTVLCSNPDSYVYIDQYHFTARMHEITGDAVRLFLAVSSGISRPSLSLHVLLCASFFLTMCSLFDFV